MNLRKFCSLIFQHCPLLAEFSDLHAAAYSEFLAYKTRVPVRGAIMLNHTMDHVILVKGWKKGSKWSFPRGKINKDEKDIDCAVREVYEETGFDLREAGLIPTDEDNAKYIDVSLREQQMRLYVFRDVPMDAKFEPKTRKEISVSTNLDNSNWFCLLTSAENSMVQAIGPSNPKERKTASTASYEWRRFNQRIKFLHGCSISWTIEKVDRATTSTKQSQNQSSSSKRNSY